LQQTEYYILFPNVDNGLKLSQLLRSAKIQAIIAPTPREASKCCGISVLINQEDDLPAVKDCIAQNDIEIISIFELTKKRDPKRDKFC
jgi:hypothetical protein